MWIKYNDQSGTLTAINTDNVTKIRCIKDGVLALYGNYVSYEYIDDAEPTLIEVIQFPSFGDAQVFMSDIMTAKKLGIEVLEVIHEQPEHITIPN